MGLYYSRTFMTKREFRTIWNTSPYRDEKTDLGAK